MLSSETLRTDEKFVTFLRSAHRQKAAPFSTPALGMPEKC